MSKYAALGGKTYTAVKPGHGLRKARDEDAIECIPNDIPGLDDVRLKNLICTSPPMCMTCDVDECRYGQEWRRRQRMRAQGLTPEKRSKK